MIKAASISYAIFVMLLTAIFCHGIVTVFSLNSQLENYYLQKSRLSKHRYSALAYGQANLGQLPTNTWSIVPGSEPDIKYLFKKSVWGLFYNLSLKTVSSSADTLEGNYLMSHPIGKDQPILYLRDNDQALKIAENTTLIGTVACSGAALQKVHINKSSSRHINHSGDLITSKKIIPDFMLPDLSWVNRQIPEKIITTGDSIYAEFSNKTKVLQASGLVDKVNISGRVILQSQDSIIIGSNAQLNDVIITAPKVIINSGFRGSIQVIAQSGIEVQPDVQLEYPSVLLIDPSSMESKIRIGEKTRVRGAIIIPKTKAALEANHQLIVQPLSKIDGLIYCGGILELYADIQGHITTAQLRYSTNDAQYTNLLKDVSIAPLQNPQWYFNPEESQNQSPAIILKKV